MAPVLRAHNWQQSPLGQPELWPQSLCMALNMCLCAHFPMALIWGSELTLLYNEGWRHLAGGMHPWCLGRSAPNLWSASWGNVARRIQSMLEGGEDVPTPMLPLTPQTGGDTCYCSMSPVRGENGKIAGFFITPAELSGHQYAVGSLRKARKEEQARNAFLAHMSHEIRTPMSAVVGLSNLLAMDRKLSGKQKEMARTLQQNAQSVLLLVNDLLDLAHIEMNGLQMECVPFTFNDILSQIFIGLSLKAQEKKISLDYEPAALGAQTYMGDPLRIKQMVGTLVSAAVNAVPRGAITITLAEDKSEKSQQCAFKFSVCSPVVRTAQQQLEWMFESMPGQKLHNTYSDAELGLFICRQLAARMGGRISLTRAADAGAVLTLHLPLLCGEAPAPQNLPPHAASVPSSTVLLVEDYKPNVIVAAHMLESLGYGCDVASNGREALARIRECRSQYAAVLMDVLMPEMDGLEATRLLRREEAEQGLPRLPVIAVTAYALQGDRERCLAAGMDAYMSKPFRCDDLRALLQEISTQLPSHQLPA